MSSLMDRIGTVAVVIAAVAVGTATVRREFFPASTANAPEVRIERWESFRSAALALGDSGAPVTIIEFADFECPFCANLHDTMKSELLRLGNRAEYQFIHFPLPNHAHAMQASRVAECAARQGRFAAIQDALYAKQDSFGAKPWTGFARDAGVPDSESFGVCLTDSTVDVRIRRGLAIAESLKIGGTPTLLINGWKYEGIRPESLRAAIERRANE